MLRALEMGVADDCNGDLRGALGMGIKPMKFEKTSAVFKSQSVEWGTPPDLYATLNSEFQFDFDPCPPNATWDGTAVQWDNKRVFCNPPYGRQLGRWLEKGREADLAVFLVPARTDTAWFHDHCLPHAKEIRFIRGRIRFVENHITKRDGADAAPFPTMLVIFQK